MSDTAAQSTEAAEIIRVAQQAIEVRPVDLKKTYITVTHDGKSAVVDLEAQKATPDRPRGIYHPATVQSLIDYLDHHHSEESFTTLWVHPTNGRVLAVLDDHGAEAPQWREHKAQLDLLHTEEWKFWTGKDGQLLNQEAFAEHLRDGLPDILEPDGADLLEIAETFQTKTQVSFRSAVEFTSGEVKFAYDEATDARAGKKGDLAVPREFKLSLAPFVGSEPVKIVANLRHRTGGGNLQIGYKLQHPERVVQTVLDGIAEELDKRFSRVYRGTSPS